VRKRVSSRGIMSGPTAGIAVEASNRLRSDWASQLGLRRNWSTDRMVATIRNEDRSLGMHSLSVNDALFGLSQFNKWDNNVLRFPGETNAWRAPNGDIVAPHTRIDPYTGNQVNWDQ